MFSFQSSNYWTFPARIILESSFFSYPSWINSNRIVFDLHSLASLTGFGVFISLYPRQVRAWSCSGEREKSQGLTTLSADRVIFRGPPTEFWRFQKWNEPKMLRRHESTYCTSRVCMSVGLVVTRLSWRTKNKRVQSTGTWQLSKVKWRNKTVDTCFWYRKQLEMFNIFF